MTETTDALELLTMQHDEVDELIGQIEDSDDPAEKAELFGELADKLAAHATMEEKLFYPSVMAKQTEDLLIESTEEHLSVKRILADMLTLDVEDAHFDAKLTVLKEQVRHHARDEEEGELFPKVRKILSKDELGALGSECLAMFETVLASQPRDQVPAETREAAALQPIA